MKINNFIFIPITEFRMDDSQYTLLKVYKTILLDPETVNEFEGFLNEDLKCEGRTLIRLGITDDHYELCLFQQTWG